MPRVLKHMSVFVSFKGFSVVSAVVIESHDY